MKFLKKIKTDESGASAAEYALMIAVMGALVVAAVGLLGGSIAGALNGATGRINTANAT